MTQFETLTAIFKAKLTEFRAGVNRAIELTQDLKQQSERAFSAVTRAANNAAEKMNVAYRAVEKTATRAGLALGAMATASAVAVGKTGFEFIKLKENAQASFATILKDGEKARRLLDSLAVFAAKTPFELPGLVEASQKMLAFGLEAEKIIPTLTAIGDAAAGLGGSQEVIDRITLSLGQMLSKGRVQAQELLQLAEAGVPAYQTLAQVLGVSIPEALKLVESGTVETSKVFDAFVKALGNRYAGLMATQSRRLGGLVSTLTDNFRDAAGTIFEPLYRKATEFLLWATGPKGLTMGDAIEKMRKSVSRIADALFGFLQKNGQDIIRGVGDAYVFAADALQKFIVYLREEGPAIAASMQYWLGWTATIAKFLADHPALVAALIEIKLLFLTGIPQAFIAVTSAIAGLSLALGLLAFKFYALNSASKFLFGKGLVSAIWTAIRAVTAFVARIGLLQGAMSLFRLMPTWFTTLAGGMLGKINLLTKGITAMKFAMIAFKIAAVAAVGAAVSYLIYQLHPAVAALRKEMDRASHQAKLTAIAVQKRRNEDNRQIDEVEDPATRRKAIQDQIAREKKELEGNVLGLEGAQNGVDEARRKAGVLGDRDVVVREALQKAAEERARVEATEAQIDALQRRLDEMDGRAQAGGEVPVVDLGGGKEAKEADKIGERIAEAQARQLERENPLLDGLQDLKEFVMSGASFDQIRAFVETIEGMTPELAEAVARGIEEGGNIDEILQGAVTQANESKQASDRSADTEFDSEDFRQNIGTSLPTEQVNGFVAQIEQLRLSFINGTISQREYDAGLQKINETARSTIEANAAIAESSKDLEQILKGTFGQTFQAGSEQVGDLKTRFAELQEQLRSGAIGVDQFKEEVKELADESERAAEAERQKRLLMGDFAGAGLDFNKAVMDRLIQARMQQFNGYVDQFVQQVYGIGDAVNNFGSMLGDASGRVQGFANSMPSGQNITDAWTRLGQFVQSLEGQRQLVLNNLALLRQNILLTEDSDQRQQLQQAINDLVGTLQMIDQQQASAPSFLTDRGDLEFRDPALKGGGSGGSSGDSRSGGSITVNLPNVRMGTADVQNMADLLEQEAQRRGWRL